MLIFMAVLLMEDVLTKLDLLSDQCAMYFTYQIASIMARHEGKYKNPKLEPPTSSVTKKSQKLEKNFRNVTTKMPSQQETRSVSGLSH